MKFAITTGRAILLNAEAYVELDKSGKSKKLLCAYCLNCNWVFKDFEL